MDRDPGGWTITPRSGDRYGQDLTVTDPQTLGQRDFDVVIVASIPGKSKIFAQLKGMGLHPGKDFVYFYDSFSIDGFRLSARGLMLIAVQRLNSLRASPSV